MRSDDATDRQEGLSGKVDDVGRKNGKFIDKKAMRDHAKVFFLLI